MPPGQHVAPRVDAPRHPGKGGERLGRAVDRPALDQARGIEARYAGRVRKARREGPVRTDARELTQPMRLRRRADRIRRGPAPRGAAG